MASQMTWVVTVVLCIEFVLRGAYGMRNAPSSSSGMESDGPQPDGTCKSMVEIHGYKCEEHTVITEDGYILSMQRIPDGRSEVTGSRTPVLLQHGVLMDGITWLLNPPDQSLAFILADSGFDVWIANTRGTLWSRGHTSLSPSDPAYWEWSWDELASYDLPAFVQYVYDQTNQKMNYVGHSLGTLMALASFSQLKLLDMVNSAALLSPIAHLGQITSPIAKAGVKAYVAERYYKSGIKEFDPKGKGVAKLLKIICKEPGINCYDLMTMFTGKNCCLNSSTIELFLEHEPQSTATKNLIHVAQMVREGTIAMYDYGDEGENMKRYGQTTPPIYNMSSIPDDFPLFLSYGGEDALSDVNDVELLLKDLKSHYSDKITVQYHYNYAHADFVMGVNAKQIVYDPMIDFFNLH